MTLFFTQITIVFPFLHRYLQSGWYWGPLSWDEANRMLGSKPDGSFLVRDSSDDRYILSLSFRSQGKTHHTRIQHYKGIKINEGCWRHVTSFPIVLSKINKCVSYLVLNAPTHFFKSVSVRVFVTPQKRVPGALYESVLALLLFVRPCVT